MHLEMKNGRCEINKEVKKSSCETLLNLGLDLKNQRSLTSLFQADREQREASKSKYNQKKQYSCLPLLLFLSNLIFIALYHSIPPQALALNSNFRQQNRNFQNDDNSISKQSEQSDKTNWLDLHTLISSDGSELIFGQKDDFIESYRTVAPLTTSNKQQQTSNLTDSLTRPTSGSDPRSSLNESLDAGGGSSTSGGTTPAEGSQEFERQLVSWILLTNLIICLVGMCGNSIVILVILEFTRFGTVNDIYILNLAFADLMFVTGLIFLIVTMHLEIWIFGNTMCKDSNQIFMSTTSINQFASSLLLVVMSFDRFLAVCHPIYAQRFRQPQRAKIICLCIWIICLILQTPVLIFARTDENMTCAIFWPESTSFNCERAFTMYSFAIGFSLPLLLIAAFYIRVVQRLRMAAHSVQLHTTSSRRHLANKRIERLVIVIICTYVICWMPYWITQISVSYTLAASQPPSFWVFIHIGTSLSYTNSALNPILYAFLSDNFKRRCLDILPSIRTLTKCCRATATSSQEDSNQQLNMSQAQNLPPTSNSNIKIKSNNKNNNQPETRITSLILESTPIHQPHELHEPHESHNLITGI